MVMNLAVKKGGISCDTIKLVLEGIVEPGRSNGMNR